MTDNENNCLVQSYLPEDLYKYNPFNCVSVAENLLFVCVEITALTVVFFKRKHLIF